MPVLLKFELFIKTFSSSGTYFSLLKLTVTSSSAVLKATKYPGLPLLILQHTHVMTLTSVCILNETTHTVKLHFPTAASLLPLWTVKCWPDN
jgi:hypothetical protein